LNSAQNARDMKKTPTLLYVLEREIGLNPELSCCNQCQHVEYIYFTGIVCHVGHPKIDHDGRCVNFMQAAQP
jgi:hypothetical protein